MTQDTFKPIVTLVRCVIDDMPKPHSVRHPKEQYGHLVTHNKVYVVKREGLKSYSVVCDNGEVHPINKRLFRVEKKEHIIDDLDAKYVRCVIDDVPTISNGHLTKEMYGDKLKHGAVYEVVGIGMYTYAIIINDHKRSFNRKLFRPITEREYRAAFKYQRS